MIRRMVGVIVGGGSGIMVTEMVAAFNGGPSDVGNFKHRLRHLYGVVCTHDWEFRNCVIGCLKLGQMNVLVSEIPNRISIFRRKRVLVVFVL